MKVLDEQGLSYLLSKLDSRYDVSGKVDKVDGKGLSTNDYTTTEKNKLAGIAAGAEVNVQSNWTQTDTAADDYIKNKPTIPTVNNNTIIILKNSTSVDSFTLNQSSNKTINITVPTKTSDLTNDSGYITDISGKADASVAIGNISLSMDSNTYKISITGTKVNGTAFTVSNVIDLPLESVVVSGSYDSTNKKVVLTLKSGSTVEFSVADLINGLQPTIDADHKLSADLISDGTTNKVYTATEKTKLSGIETGALKNPNVLSTLLITLREHYSINTINGLLFSEGIKVLLVEDTKALDYYTSTGRIHEYPRIILKGVSSTKVIFDDNRQICFCSYGEENAYFHHNELQFDKDDYVLYRCINYYGSIRTYIYGAEAVIPSTDSILTSLNLIKGEDDLLYQIHPENGDVTPLSHPDLSTQPSILPQRFGKYDIKEVLLPVFKKTHNTFYPVFKHGDTIFEYQNQSAQLSNYTIACVKCTELFYIFSGTPFTYDISTYYNSAYWNKDISVDYVVLNLSGDVVYHDETLVSEINGFIPTSVVLPDTGMNDGEWLYVGNIDTNERCIWVSQVIRREGDMVKVYDITQSLDEEPTSDKVYYDDNSVLTLMKDEKFVNGNIMEISLFGNGYCTHPTVKLIDDTYKIYPMIPYEDMSKLEFALIRYMTVRDNYYYVPEVNSNEGRILYQSEEITLRYSTAPQFEQVGDYNIQYSSSQGTAYLIDTGFGQYVSFNSRDEDAIREFMTNHYDMPIFLAIRTADGNYISHNVVILPNGSNEIEINKIGPDFDYTKYV